MKITPELHKELISLDHAYLDEKGREMCNPKPLVVHSGLKRQEPIRDQIKRVLRQELSRQAHEQGFETFDEANDFDIDDEDPDFLTSYEIQGLEDEYLPQEPQKESPPQTEPPKPETSPPPQEGGKSASEPGGSQPERSTE